jgi:putative membrane protein
MRTFFQELAMNRYLRWGAALVLLPLAACNADRSNAFNATVPQPMAAAVTMSSQDGRFISAVGPSDQFEMQTSQIALQKSRNPDVRAYAQQMIDQHTTSSQQLTQLAAAKGANLSQGLDPTQERLLAAVQGAGPGSFDRTYLSGQITGHTATVLAYNDEVKSGQDADVKAYAQQNLPMIQQHLVDARRLSARR